MESRGGEGDLQLLAPLTEAVNFEGVEKWCAAEFPRPLRSSHPSLFSLFLLLLIDKLHNALFVWPQLRFQSLPFD